jgi:imidazolonepropionase-like amidohydrolase
MLITNATVLTGDGQRLDDTSVYVADGRIQWVGDGETRAGCAGDRRQRPLADTGDHRCAFAPGRVPQPGGQAHSDGNEATAPVTAEVWAEHSIWPQDPGFVRALAGGVTTLQVCPVPPTCSAAAA